MKLFNTVALEITSLCNRKCAFCPVSHHKRDVDERMDSSLLEKALTELGSLKYSGRIEFYIYNEPMRDREYLLETLKLARRLCPKAGLMIATNGDYLKGPAGITPLFEAGLNQLLINCYSPGLFERRVKWLEALGDVVIGGNVYLRCSPRKKIVKLEDKSKPFNFGKGVFAMVNRAGNIPNMMDPLKKPLEKMCVKPFRFLNINWLGEALVCCQDYHGEMTYGNLQDSTLVELWNHPVMNTYRRRLLLKNRNLPLCCKCDCHAGAYSHNVPKPDGLGWSTMKILKMWRQNLSCKRLSEA